VSRLVASHGASRGGPSTSRTDTVTDIRGPNYTTPGDSPRGDPVKVVTPARCERLWTIADVSEFLSVPVQTLYHWRHRGEGPPAIRLGKHLRYDPERVREWVGSQGLG
jgi:predicted DNA-binding transcriptional regulator AlpA